MSPPPVDRSPETTPELQALVGLFHPSLDAIGAFREVSGRELPDAAQRLLWHDAHMTVTLEAFHRSAMDVSVLEVHKTPTHYARQILLKCHDSPKVTQYGIVRLNTSLLSDPVRREVERQQTPLGRILITWDVMRKVRLLSLWEICPGPVLQKWFATIPDRPCFGRTALIYCNQVPAVELLEIVPS